MRVQRAPGLEVADGRPEDGVRLVGGLPVEVAVPDLLGDHRQPEQPEHLVEAPLSGVIPKPIRSQ